MSVSTIPGFDLQPSAQRVPLKSNYITNFDFLNQYLPDTYEKEFERYGNRSVASFLRMVGAEMPSNSDLIKWAEQGRLHIAYDTVTSGAAAAKTIILPSPGADGKVPLLGPGMTVVIALGNTTVKAFIKSVGALAGGLQTYNLSLIHI